MYESEKNNRAGQRIKRKGKEHWAETRVEVKSELPGTQSK